MKVAMIMLLLLFVAFGALCIRRDRMWREAAQATSNQVAATSAELALVRTEARVRVTDMQNSIASAQLEKTQLVDKLNEFQTRLDTIERDLQEERNQIVPVDNKREKVTRQLASASNQLVAVRQRLLDLNKTNTLSEAEMATLLSKNSSLQLESDALERQLVEVDAERAQISWLKHRIWAEKIATWKRHDLERTTGGSGILQLKEGRWQTITRTNRPAAQP